MIFLQDELIEAIVLPNLANIDLEPNSEVKLMAVELIVDLAGSSTSRRFHDLLGILQKVRYRTFYSICVFSFEQILLAVLVMYEYVLGTFL